MWKSVTSVAFRTFSLTLWHQHLCILSVPFRTINLVLFAQIIITHPDTCWEGLMTATADRQSHVTSRHGWWLLNVVTISFQALPSYLFPRILSLWESFPFCWTCSPSCKTLKQTTPIVSLSYSFSRLSFRCWTFLPSVSILYLMTKRRSFFSPSRCFDQSLKHILSLQFFFIFLLPSFLW